ncbi:MAG: thioredoxin domain-containing protein [bacterium]|nr:thioredoxin domain-containing protein [bacterium]
MDEELTPKEVYDLRKEGERKVGDNLKKKKQTTRFVKWFFVLVLLGGSVWGLTKLSTNPSDGQGAILADTVSASDWVKGNKDSKTLLVEYSDLQCPACRAYYPMVKKLIEEQGKDFQFAYRHFPLGQHKNAKKAAYAMEAAGRQGKLWEMHDMIFDGQDTWAPVGDAENIFAKYAESLSLNKEKFNQDSNSQKAKDKVENDYNSGVRSRVNSTPTFFLNGKKIQPRSYDEFVNLVKEEIAKNQ